MLSKSAGVARALEDLYSWRHKDLASRKTRLSPEESLRFHRALYRAWLFSSTFGAYRVGEVLTDYPEVQEAQLEEELIPFFDQFDSRELKEVGRVYTFLTGVYRAEGPVSDPHDELIGNALAIGPHAILKAYEDKTLNDSCEFGNFSWGVLPFKPLKTALVSRLNDMSDVGFSDNKVILDTQW